VILDFQLPKSSVDINVSPDKRTIYLHSEANLIDSLTVGSYKFRKLVKSDTDDVACQVGLNEFFAPSRGVFTEQNHSVAPLSESLRGEAKATGNKEPLFLDEDAEMEIPQTSLQRKETGNNKVPGSVRDTSPLRRRERSPQEVSARSTGSLRLAPKPSTPSNLSVVDLMSSGIVIGTPSPTQKLPDSHFTPIDKKTLEYEEEDELDELESEDETIKGANRNRSPVILLSKDSTEDETLPTGKRKKLVQPTLTGLGGGWKLSKVENVTPASSEKRTVPKTQSRRSFRDRLMGFASQKAKVDLDEVHSDNGNDEADEVAVYTRPIEVDEPDGELTREPSSDNIDLDLERALNPDETQEHEISTSDLPDGTLAISHKHRSHRDDTQDGIEYIADGQDESQTPGELEEKAGFRNEIASRASKREITLTCDMDRIRRNYKASRRRLTPVEGNKLDTGRSEGLPREAFLPEAGVTITDAVKADRALSKVIKKQDFASMQVIGQYNRAFIIARNVSSDPGDPSNDLFIIDQHAADEKYNFETLQTVTKIQSQRLLK
jgi:DNA mismatch repair protein PMS2